MSAVPLLSSERHWECGGCTAAHVTTLPGPHAPMHQCPGMRGLLVPYVPAGSRVKVTAHEREDWIAGELVQSDGDGRPVMSVTVEDDDHIDAVVYAATARLEAR